jgi:hypothetical protein
MQSVTAVYKQNNACFPSWPRVGHRKQVQHNNHAEHFSVYEATVHQSLTLTMVMQDALLG